MPKAICWSCHKLVPQSYLWFFTKHGQPYGKGRCRQCAAAIAGPKGLHVVMNLHCRPKQASA